MKEQQKKLIELIKEAISHDQQLREKYQIGNKFRFIQDKLSILAENLGKGLQAYESKEKKVSAGSTKDEVIVYVYLFNAQGLNVPSWLKMLTPKIFYEHSVNRPIYLEKSCVEAFIRSKPKAVQHAYLTVAVHQNDMIQTESSKDSLGQTLVKIKEGSLHFEKLIAFTHNGNNYTVNEEGELVNKIAK